MLMFGTLHWQMERVCHPNCGGLNLFEHVQKLFYLAVPFLQFALLINKHHKHKFSKKRGFAFKSSARHQGNALPTKNWRRTCRVHQECATIAQRWNHEWAVLKRSLIYCSRVILPPPHHSQRFWDCSACLRACLLAKAFAKGFCELARTKVLFPQISIWPGYLRGSNKTGFGRANKLKAWIWACIGRVIAACVFHDRLLKHLSTSDMPDPSMQVHSYGYNSKWMHLSHYLKAMLLQSLLMWDLMKPID